MARPKSRLERRNGEAAGCESEEHDRMIARKRTSILPLGCPGREMQPICWIAQRPNPEVKRHDDKTGQKNHSKANQQRRYDGLPCLEVPIIGVLPMLEPCPPAQSRDWANYQENLFGQIDHRIVEPLMMADKSVEERVLHGI